MKPGIALLVLLLHAAPVPADPPLEIIGLRSRPADEVVPLIKPFAGPDGAVSGMNNQLFIRTSPERLEEIKAILEKVDRPPRRLLISVRQGSLTTEERQRRGRRGRGEPGVG